MQKPHSDERSVFTTYCQVYNAHSVFLDQIGIFKVLSLSSCKITSTIWDSWHTICVSERALLYFISSNGNLDGPWDSENALGNRIRPHTDIRDIDNGLTPLWFDGVDPSKVVLGLAYYGRTFTATNSDCPIMGCAFKGPGKPYGCTNHEGVLSNMGTYFCKFIFIVTNEYLRDSPNHQGDRCQASTP